MKRFVALSLMLMLALTLGAPALADGNLNEVGTLPICKEKTVLTILLQEQTLVEDYDTNAYTKYLEDTLNIDIQFEFLPATNPGDKLAVMISSAQKLPDVVCFSLSAANAYKYAQAGAFIPLDEYIEKYSVNFKGKTAMYPELNLEKLMRSPDGHTYALPFYAPSLSDETRYKLWINQKWLEKLNLSMPTTTEELIKVLRAFKEGDPNGNGKNDEYPLVGATGWSQDATVALMNSFVYNDNAERFFIEDGQLKLAYMQEEWKDGLHFIKDLLTEDLLAPISLTQTSEQLKAMVNNEGECIVGCFAYSAPTLIGAASPWFEDYVALEPVAGPKGVQFSAYVKTSPQFYWFVTSDCTNKELAFRVGDYMFDEEVMMLNRYGVEDEQWTRASDEEAAAHGVKLAFYQTASQNIFGVSQNVNWRGAGPHFFGSPMAMNLSSANDRYLRGIDCYMRHIPAPDAYLPTLLLNDEELEMTSEIRATLKSYVNNMTAMFITGNKDIDGEWDAFQNELRNIGVETYIQVYQQAYDRDYK